jgi:DNA-binding transcriptional regulator WhiA
MKCDLCVIIKEEQNYYARELSKKWDNVSKKYNIFISDPVWKQSSTLSANDFIGLSINTNNITPDFTYEKTINKIVIEKTTTILDKDEHWFLIGYFLACGSIEAVFGKNGKPRPNIVFVIQNKYEIEILDKLLKILQLTEQKECRTKKTKTFTCYNRVWTNILRDLEVDCDVDNESTKKIPNWVYDASTDYIQSFIIGYMKGSGFITKSGIYVFTSVSYVLICGLQKLFFKLGYIFTIKMQSIKDKNIETIENVYILKGKMQKTRMKSFIQDNYAWISLQMQ